MESKSDEPRKADTSATERTNGRATGEARDDNSLKMKLVWCPPGTFMSSDDEDGSDQIEVMLTKGFWLGRFEVTQTEWKQVMMTEPWKDKRLTEEELDLPKEGTAFPATFVNWEDAMEFCRKLTERERKAGRVPKGWEYTLPTEAQWEYACRAGMMTKFNFGDDESKLGEHAWFSGNVAAAGEFYAHAVGRKKPNAWGLYDMHGNVAEWCRDWYRYERLGGRDPEVRKRPGQYRCRVHRGGNWDCDARFCPSSCRGGSFQDSRGDSLGFRVALSAVPPAEPDDKKVETPSSDK
jgi:formylglycine-generating enzyme required for sulfatase activity